MEEDKKTKIFKTTMLIVLTALITFILTSVVLYKEVLNKNSLTLLSTEASKEESTISTKLQQYKKIIDKYFLGEIDNQKLEEGAIKGYIEGLNDPYTEYISKDEMNDYLDDTMGNFVGIGIYMVKNTQYNRIQVLSPIKGSPAETAGIEPGDLIISVDDVEYTGDQTTEAANNIKGETGTKVKLTLLRDTQTLTFEITREKIKMNTVEGKVLENNTGYIEFTSFDESTAQDFKTKYQELEKQGIKSLIIDLRNNGGGLVNQATEIADFIADKGSIILYEVDKNNNEKVTKSEENPIINMPIAVLTNENTASASEILAGALKDLGKAQVVGTKTYGKGVIQQILTLSDGSGLKITIEEYQTPNRNKINKIGIEPDVEVELPENVTSILNVDEKDDTQLQKAVEILK